MSKKSAVETIKKLNPKNVSGTIPEALNMIETLKKSKGNPLMIESVGAASLVSTLKHIQQLFKKPKKNNEQKTPQEIIEEEVIKKIEETIEELNVPTS